MEGDEWQIIVQVNHWHTTWQVYANNKYLQSTRVGFINGKNIDISPNILSSYKHCKSLASVDIEQAFSLLKHS